MDFDVGRGGVGVRNRQRVKRQTPFTEWFTAALDGMGLSLNEFARRAGLGGPSIVSRWASGEAEPTIGMCKKIAQVLRVDLDFVLEKAGYRDPSLVGERDERGGILASMVKRVDWSKDETRYSTVFRIIRGYLEEDRLRELDQGPITDN